MFGAVPDTVQGTNAGALSPALRIASRCCRRRAIGSIVSLCSLPSAGADLQLL
jgi:hypothetical protein